MFLDVAVALVLTAVIVIVIAAERRPDAASPGAQRRLTGGLLLGVPIAWAASVIVFTWVAQALNPDRGAGGEWRGLTGLGNLFLGGLAGTLLTAAGTASVLVYRGGLGKETPPAGAAGETATLVLKDPRVEKCFMWAGALAVLFFALSHLILSVLIIGVGWTAIALRTGNWPLDLLATKKRLVWTGLVASILGGMAAAAWLVIHLLSALI